MIKLLMIGCDFAAHTNLRHHQCRISCCKNWRNVGWYVLVFFIYLSNGRASWLIQLYWRSIGQRRRSCGKLGDAWPDCTLQIRRIHWRLDCRVWSNCYTVSGMWSRNRKRDSWLILALGAGYTNHSRCSASRCFSGDNGSGSAQDCMVGIYTGCIYWQSSCKYEWGWSILMTSNTYMIPSLIWAELRPMQLMADW